MCLRYEVKTSSVYSTFKIRALNGIDSLQKERRALKTGSSGLRHVPPEGANLEMRAGHRFVIRSDTDMTTLTITASLRSGMGALLCLLSK